MVLTRIAWAAIVTSAHRFSQDLQTRTWHSCSRFLLIYTPASDRRNNELIEMTSFVGNIESFVPSSKNESAFETLFSEYERVIIQSLNLYDYERQKHIPYPRHPAWLWTHH